MSFVGAGSVANPVPADRLQKKAHTQLCKPWCLRCLPPSLWWHLWGFSPVVLKLADWLWGQLQLTGESGQVLPGGLRALEQVPAAWCVRSSSEPLAALGQQMAGARSAPGPPRWLAGSLPRVNKAAQSEAGGGEQLRKHVSLRSFTLC